MTELRKRIRFSTALTQLNMSRSTGYRHIESGILPTPHKIGGIPYFYMDELEAALTAASEAAA